MELTALGECLATPSCVVFQTVGGLKIGMLLFLVASGLTLIFGVLGVINFAHGTFYMLGAYLAHTAIALSGSFTVGVIAAALGTDRQSTRLNSCHPLISHAVFCLKIKTYSPVGAADTGSSPYVPSGS